ncbi:hypothetical protein GRAN_2285 [Granulicella sibirica]|uniref:Uncharacterized protein n=1 Tax=Granulicella sibirica TaxID=2479048 RepID=A0A4Q0T5E8_9BACT|nr:hypothetical protein GRAN_2285 [Granulicella sibirica]
MGHSVYEQFGDARLLGWQPKEADAGGGEGRLISQPAGR